MKLIFLLLGIAAILTDGLLIGGSILTPIGLTAIFSTLSPDNNSQKKFGEDWRERYKPG